MSGEKRVNDAGSSSALSEEIAGLCSEFPEVPIIEIARHAVTNGASQTRQKLMAGQSILSIPSGKESL